MKIKRKQLKRLIESLINEGEESAKSENIRILVRSLLQGNIKKAESEVQKLGTSEVMLNKIDSVFRSNYHNMAKDHMGGGMSPAFTERAEKGISFIISDASRHHMPDAFKEVDSDDTGPAYVKATQTALKDFPGLLALFNANK